MDPQGLLKYGARQSKPMSNQRPHTRAAKAAVVRGKGAPFVIEDVRVGPPAADEVLVRVVAAGICHTDAIVRDQYYPFPLPGVLGHEGSGVIEEVGSGVTNVAVGDHVVLTFMSCGDCRYCQRGETAYCSDFFMLNVGGARKDGTTGTRDAHGDQLHDHFFGQSSFGTYAVAHGRNVIKVPKDIPLEVLGPLGCGIQTGAGAILNALEVGAGASVAVFGVGGVGLSAVMAARAAGATTIIAIDVLPSRLELALELGATHSVNSANEDAVEAVRKISGFGVDFSLDTSGRPNVLRQAIDTLAIRGVCGIVGAPPLGTEASFDVNSLMIPGRSIRGICEGDSLPTVFIPQLIELYRQGRFPYDRLIRFYDFADINAAVQDAATGVTIKPVLRMPQESSNV
jgi:aryl-alcohol dehydrogenase